MKPRTPPLRRRTTINSTRSYILLASLLFLVLFSSTLVLFHSSLPTLSPASSTPPSLDDDVSTHDNPKSTTTITTKRSPQIQIEPIYCALPDPNHPHFNDNFCDCPDTSSDEPSTSACSKVKHSTFVCSARTQITIYSSRIDDSVCDCCDGSDEIHNNYVVCPNTCPSLRGEGFI
ncbi:hypothetical protein TrLO_g7022 [Triparma laevis f. longispina]|uniref:Glucosidase II beta subunit N-terminal domain-containing protein n=1 Tax=Triparma laevis f. longispina TaxID=1714387 RepID=A0A9W7ARY8_9STRA|nr:hypothetical protein TrLO_g7022 [Triparma laevis f. longispina]